jgi:hypothetical protein
LRVGLSLQGAWTQNASLKGLKSERTVAPERLKADWRKVELEVRIIRHFRVGYILILSTPALSLVVLTLVVLVLAGIQDYLLPIIMVTASNASVVVLLIMGIALYIYGYLRREATDAEAKVILLFSFSLVPWAVFTYLFASGLQSDAIVRSMNLGMRVLTIWDYMEYWTWELKAILWIGTGLLLIVTSLVKMQATRALAR